MIYHIYPYIIYVYDIIKKKHKNLYLSLNNFDLEYYYWLHYF